MYRYSNKAFKMVLMPHPIPETSPSQLLATTIRQRRFVRRRQRRFFCPVCKAEKVEKRAEMAKISAENDFQEENELWELGVEELIIRIHRLECVIEDLQAECKSLQTAYFSRQKSENIPEQIDRLLAIFSDLRIVVSAKAIKHAFFLRAQTLEETKQIIANSDRISKFCTNKRKKIEVETLEFFLENFNSVRRAFKNRANIRANTQYLLQVFGRSAVRKVSDDMVFFWNEATLKSHGTIVFAHCDGKYTKCLSPWTQTFEMILVFEHNGRRAKKTLAFAFLNGSKKDIYLEFFKTVKNMHCPNIPIMITDFEIAISKAAKEVWKGIVVRGCYYHYTINLLNKQSEIKRRFDRQISDATFNVVKIAPFVPFKSLFFFRYLLSMSLAEEEMFTNADFRLIEYVFSTYVKRFKEIFSIDVCHLLDRTKNACEGRNSGLARSFTQRPSVREMIEFISIRMKVDIANEENLEPLKNPGDDFFCLVQIKAKKNLSTIVDLCRTLPKIQNMNMSKIIEQITCMDFRDTENITSEDELFAKNELEKIISRFKIFKKRKHERYEELKDITYGVETRIGDCFSNNKSDVLISETNHLTSQNFIDTAMEIENQLESEDAKLNSETTIEIRRVIKNNAIGESMIESNQTQTTEQSAQKTKKKIQKIKDKTTPNKKNRLRKPSN